MNNRQVIRPIAWLIWGTATLYFYFDFINQIIPGAIETQLQDAFKSTSAELGWIADSYFYIYALMQIPVGLLADRFGPKRPLLVAAIMAVSGCFLFYYASSVETAILARVVTGAGAAFSFVSCLKLVSNWFPANWFATMVGITNVIGMLGAVTAGRFSALAEPDALGWRKTILVIAFIGVAAAFLIFLVVRDRPKDSLPSAEPEQESTLKNLLAIVAMPQAWLAGVYVATINTTFIILGGLWAAPFLQKAYSISSVDAVGMTTMIFWGGIPGSFFFGWFSDSIIKRKLPMIIGATGGLASFAVLLYVPGLPQWCGYVLLFLLGFFCCSNVVAYAFAGDIGPKNSEGASLGFVNTWLIGGAAAFGPFVGWLLDRHGSAAAGEHSIADYRFALSAITASLAVCLLVSIILRETDCKHTHRSYENERKR